MTSANKSALPLTESTYLILLSLVSPCHGYAVMQKVESMSGGSVTIGPGTLYGALKALLKKGWIQELPTDEPRRKSYRLTENGNRILRQEVDRLEKLAQLGKKNI